MARKLNTLVICHSRQLRRQFEAWSDTLRYQIFLADGRAEGLAMMYKLHPDLIFLETIVDQPESWQILSIIRLFTNTPVLMIADRPPDAKHRPLLAGNSIVLVHPISPRKIASATKVVLSASGMYSTRSSSPGDTGAPQSEPPVAEPIDRLTWLGGLVSRARSADPVQAIDQELLDRLLVLLDADWVAIHRAKRDTSMLFDLESRRTGVGEWSEAQTRFVTHRVLEAVRTRNLIVLNESATVPDISEGADLASQAMGSFAVVPLVGRTRVHGALCVVGRHDAGTGFTVPQIQFMTTVGETLALALDTALLAQQNRESAIWDEATGIHSTAYADHVVEFEKRRASRYGSKFAVVQLEWMNGQEYRDARGDQDYERVLRDIASVSQNSVRASDVVAHAHEGCISLVLPMTDPADAQHMVNRLNDRLRANFAEYAAETRPVIAAQILREGAAI